MTNKGLAKKVDLQEFYVFLEGIFYMSCYQEIPDRELWWSARPIDMFNKAPFRINAYMSRNKFRKNHAGSLVHQQGRAVILH
jgi:hypothetical protein